MTIYADDDRTPERRALDEQIAAEAEAEALAESLLPRRDYRPDAFTMTFEEAMASLKAFKMNSAYSGEVIDGKIQLADDSIQLPDHTRVIVVTGSA